MRLHDLQVTAFGPFVETVRVDFDALTEAGLFLLTGDTGAGKTSVLDAVCFALYGEVPGDRHTARHLRSDQAAAEVEPQVVLTCSINGRTFRIRRSPAWDRPRRRGAGTRRIQAHVVVEERSAGQWVALTNRLDEAGHLISGLLGMTCGQFTQVCMLPQGRFQAFLRASSAERHAVLTRLFRTRRFEDVERWLVDRRLELRRRSQSAHDEVAATLHRFQEAAGVCVPDEWDLQLLDTVAPETLRAWVDGVVVDVRDEGARLEATLQQLTTEAELRRSKLDEARGLAAAQERARLAHAELEHLDQTAEDEVALARALERHVRAAPICRFSERAQRNAAHLDEARAAVRRLVADLPGPLQAWAPVALNDPDDAIDYDVPDNAPYVSSDELVAAVAAERTRVSSALAVTESWSSAEAELEKVRSRAEQLGAALESADAEREQLGRHLAAAQPRRASLGLVLERARLVAARHSQDLRAAREAEQGAAAAALAVELRHRREQLRLDLSEATTRAHDLREHHLDLRERRITGMAAELASGLVVGCSCPVCGSADHPAPAVSSARVGAEEEDAARAAHETAEFERQTLREVLATLEVEIGLATQRAEGLDVAHWQEACALTAESLRESNAAQADLTRLEARLAAEDVQVETLTGSLRATEVRRATTAEQLGAATARAQRLELDLGALVDRHRGAHDVATVGELVAALTAAHTCLDQLHEALSLEARAREAHEAGVRAALDAAREAGFATVTDAVEAVLTADGEEAAAIELEQRRATRSAATATLAEPAVASAVLRPAPDLQACRDLVSRTEESRDAVVAESRRLTAALSRVASLAHELDVSQTSWQPLRDEHELVGGLAALVEGRSADNQLKMRLSAYVLGERLRQVTAAANDRLGVMTDQRYRLEQCDEKGAGEQRGGLSLRVRDEWSDRVRDPATLSGGETFVVSLALALGLADTVSHEAGGATLETLFVDEGFGALDAATLDAVMDTLDSLRDGGRIVGLVSHVAELRTRIPAQLEVLKSREGSTVRVRVATG